MEKNGPRLLVTGGAGFVLSNLVHHWLEIDNSASAVIFDQNKAWDDSIQEFLGKFTKDGRLCFFDGDVSCSNSWILLEKVHGTKFTHVVAGAAVTPTREEEKQNPLKIIEVNLQGTLKCFEFVRLRLPNIKRCIHISSDAVLGVDGLIHSSGSEPSSDPEAAPFMSLYALSKFSGEAAARRWKENYNMDLVSVRFSDVYGRLDRNTGARNIHNAPYRVCRKVLEIHNKSLLTSKDKASICINVAAPSLHSVCWDMVDAESVASGLTAILKSPNEPLRQVYHIALGRTPTILEVIESAFGHKIESNDYDKIRLVEENLPNVSTKEDIDITCLSENHWLKSNPIDIEPMKNEFGWHPERIGIAIQKYMKHLREYQEKSILIA